MKRIKIGVAIIFLTVAIYFVISYGIFWVKKSSLDMQLSSSQQKNIQLDTTNSDEKVVIQSMNQKNDQDDDLADDSEVMSDRVVVAELFKQSADQDEYIFTNEQENMMPSIDAEKEPEFIIRSDRAIKTKDVVKSDSYSFVVMPLPDDYTIDDETQRTLDILMGNDIDDFVKLILQSNNNIVSGQACRSCGIYAFFNKLKKHQLLAVDEVAILQKQLANLYQFVEKMKLLSDVDLMQVEQYHALQDLNQSQIMKKDIKSQVRKASTMAALKKLQAIAYNR